MKRTTIMLPEELTAKVRERVGGQGLSPLVRDLLTAWLADGSLPVPAPSEREPKPEAHRRRSTGPAPQGVGGRGPLPGKPIVGLAPPRGKDTQGPTCPRCTGLATYVKGKPRCMAGCKS